VITPLNEKGKNVGVRDKGRPYRCSGGGGGGVSERAVQGAREGQGRFRLVSREKGNGSASIGWGRKIEKDDDKEHGKKARRQVLRSVGGRHRLKAKHKTHPHKKKPGKGPGQLLIPKKGRKVPFAGERKGGGKGKDRRRGRRADRGNYGSV